MENIYLLDTNFTTLTGEKVIQTDLKNPQGNIQLVLNLSFVNVSAEKNINVAITLKFNDIFLNVITKNFLLRPEDITDLNLTPTGVGGYTIGWSTKITLNGLPNQDGILEAVVEANGPVNKSVSSTAVVIHPFLQSTVTVSSDTIAPRAVN